MAGSNDWGSKVVTTKVGVDFPDAGVRYLSDAFCCAANRAVFLAVVGCTAPQDADAGAAASSSQWQEHQPRADPTTAVEVSNFPVGSGRQFSLVAARMGDISFHRAWDEANIERMVLVASLPYPFVDNELQTLPGLHEGLVSPEQDAWLEASVAGAFAGPGDGWLTMQVDLEMPTYNGIPLSYQWQGSGWLLLRKRVGRFTEVPSSYISRGQTVFAQAWYARLRTPTQIRTSSLQEIRRGAPPPQLVRLRGDLPAPEFVDAPTSFHHSNWATTSDGHLYRVSPIPTSSAEKYRLELLDWEPDQATPHSTPLPDAASIPQVRIMRVHVSTAAEGVLIAGNLILTGAAEPVAYLAVGTSGKLTRLPVECGASSCRGRLESAAMGPDGEYWLALNGELHSLDTRGQVRPIPMPDLQNPDSGLDLRAWYWTPDHAWQMTGLHATDWLRYNTMTLEGIERVGADLWLRMVVHGSDDKIVTVFKTGPSTTPVALPSRERIRGEILRRNDPWIELRLRRDAKREPQEEFVTQVIASLGTRPEIRQICEVDRDGERDIIAIIAPQDWREELLEIYGNMLGRTPVRMDGPYEVIRVIARPHDRAAIVRGTPLSSDPPPTGTGRMQVE